MLADMLQLLTKDDWVPPFADRPVFVFAPTAIVVAMLLGFAVVPFSPELYVLDINIGLLFFLGMTSLAVYSVLLGGLASAAHASTVVPFSQTSFVIGFETFNQGFTVPEAGDYRATIVDFSTPWVFDDPGQRLGPKANAFWKPA